MRPDLPTGTVTFLFTDVMGSTRLLDEVGPGRYAEALAEHRAALRRAFAEHDGVEVDTQGDAFFVAFARASDALAAAREGQAALAAGAVRVRMGVHTGEPLLTGEGYVGMDVHRAARIAAAGHGGQVLASQPTRDLSGSEVLRDLGEHRLKDLSAPERLWQLGDDEFPPLKTLFQTNLPVPATPFLGRESELAEVETLIRDNRIVTLTGPGGSGKTRLALQAAGASAERFEAGVWWVPLAQVRDASIVLGAAGQALGSSGELADHILDRQLLLLLDNFEQVISAAPGLALLLARCPRLVLLVTSREALRIDGEWEYAVDPLREREAVELFETRARAARRDFAGNGETRAICARLDNLPLAIELAAARVKVLSPAALLERLDRRLPVLSSGARDAPERQRTLRATIEWSHDLLSAQEQRLFRRLAIFGGGSTLEAAESICDGDLDTLASLIDKSLVRQTGDRFWMLETIREYALEQLGESGEHEALALRHAEFFLEVAESANLFAEARGPQHHEVANLEQDNLRAALSWCDATDRVELALKIVVALENFWASSAPIEGLHWLDRLAPRAQVSRHFRMRVLRVVGSAGYMAGEHERANAAYDESLAEARALGDELAVGVLLHRVATSAGSLGDHPRARELSEESLAVARRLEFPKLELLSLGTLGHVEWLEGNPEKAIELQLRSAELAEEVGVAWWRVAALLHASDYALELGRLDDAERWGRASLATARSIGARQFLVEGLAMLATVARRRGERARAGLLWGAVEAEEARAPIGAWERGREEAAARVVSDDGAFVAAREEGRRLPLEEAVEEALRDDE